jgi:hypothetical protein
VGPRYCVAGGASSAWPLGEDAASSAGADLLAAGLGGASNTFACRAAGLCHVFPRRIRCSVDAILTPCLQRQQPTMPALAGARPRRRLSDQTALCRRRRLPTRATRQLKRLECVRERSTPNMANANVLNFPGSGQTVEAQQAEFCWRPRCLFQLEQREQTWKCDELWAVCKRCGLRRAFLSSRHDHMLAFLRHLATVEDAPAQWDCPTAVSSIIPNCSAP